MAGEAEQFLRVVQTHGRDVVQDAVGVAVFEFTAQIELAVNVTGLPLLMTVMPE